MPSASLRLLAPLLAATLAAIPATAVDAGGEAEILRRAAAAASSVQFSGTVSVRWLDRGGMHRETLPVKGSGGVVSLGHQPGVGVGVVWAGGINTTHAPPDPARKYGIRAEQGPVLLGRPTTTIVLLLGDAVRELVDLDKASGLVLRRRMIDTNGEIVREVELVALDDQTPAPSGSAGPAPKKWSAKPVHRLPSPYRAPATVGAGYERLGIYDRSDAIQALYGDGVHTLSVFLQAGVADAKALPRGGAVVDLGEGALGRQWAWAGGYVVTWSDGSITTTIVGDGPLSEVIEAARGFPQAASFSISRRVRRACKDAVSLIA
jgi:hypothetical protein